MADLVTGQYRLKEDWERNTVPPVYESHRLGRLVSWLVKTPVWWLWPPPGLSYRRGNLVLMCYHPSV